MQKKIAQLAKRRTISKRSWNRERAEMKNSWTQQWTAGRREKKKNTGSNYPHQKSRIERWSRKLP